VKSFGSHSPVRVAVENLVARLARNPELGAQRRHLLPIEGGGAFFVVRGRLASIPEAYAFLLFS
jgi:hypothetical protein